MKQPVDESCELNTSIRANERSDGPGSERDSPVERSETGLLA